MHFEQHDLILLLVVGMLSVVIPIAHFIHTTRLLHKVCNTIAATLLTAYVFVACAIMLVMWTILSYVTMCIDVDGLLLARLTSKVRYESSDIKPRS